MAERKLIPPDTTTDFKKWIKRIDVTEWTQKPVAKEWAKSALVTNMRTWAHALDVPKAKTLTLAELRHIFKLKSKPTSSSSSTSTTSSSPSKKKKDAPFEFDADDDNKTPTTTTVKPSPVATSKKFDPHVDSKSPSATKIKMHDSKEIPPRIHVLRGKNVYALEHNVPYKRLYRTCFPGQEGRPVSPLDYLFVYGATSEPQDWLGFLIVQTSVVFTTGIELLIKRTSDIDNLEKYPHSMLVYTISDICVGPTLRRQGVGKRLLESAVTAVRAIHTATQPKIPGRIEIQVFASNTPAYHMYTDFGFHEVHRSSAMNVLTRKSDIYVELELPLKKLADMDVDV